jgi:hypothetical protein
MLRAYGSDSVQTIRDGGARLRVTPNGFLGLLNRELGANAMTVLLDRGTGFGAIENIVRTGGSGAVGVCCGAGGLRQFVAEKTNAPMLHRNPLGICNLRAFFTVLCLFLFYWHWLRPQSACDYRSLVSAGHTKDAIPCRGRTSCTRGCAEPVLKGLLLWHRLRARHGTA